LLFIVSICFISKPKLKFKFWGDSNVVVNTYYMSKCIQLWEGSREGQWTCLDSEKIFCRDTLLFFMFLQFYFIHFSKQSLPLVVPINLAQLSTKKLISFQMPTFFLNLYYRFCCFFGSNRIKCESRYCTVWHQLGPILHLDSTMTCRNYVCWMKVCTLWSILFLQQQMFYKIQNKFKSSLQKS